MAETVVAASSDSVLHAGGEHVVTSGPKQVERLKSSSDEYLASVAKRKTNDDVLSSFAKVKMNRKPVASDPTTTNEGWVGSEFCCQILVHRIDRHNFTVLHARLRRALTYLTRSPCCGNCKSFTGESTLQ